MAASERSPRIWNDVEQGAEFGNPAASVAVFEELRSSFGTFTEVWLFNSDSSPLIRGFYYPLSASERFRIPRGLGPHMVLIDELGDHLWLSGLACGAGEKAAKALEVLENLEFDINSAEPSNPTASKVGRQSPLAGFDEMHFVDRWLVGSRAADQPVPTAAPGKTFVRTGHLVARMEFDKGRVTANDLTKLWAMATEPYGWLGRPTALTLYDDNSRSEKSGHDGCQLIAAGESGRELWLQLPEPDEYDRLTPGRRREHYEGAFTEFQAVKREIFHGVGIDLDPPDDRPLLSRILGQHPEPPAVIHWP
jgi:hypothetical protein